MKQHARIGADILSAIDFPYPVVPIVRHHHENWDGSGYPDGLSGEEIPQGARVLSVVDCFDALTSDRPYRPCLPDTEALAILRDRSGSMYDPRVVETFARIYKAIAPTNHEVERTHGLDELLGKERLNESTETRDSSLDDIAASTEEMLTVYGLARSLTARVTLSDAGDIIAKHLKRLLPASTCAYFMYDSESDMLVARHVTGLHSQHFSGLEIGMGERLSGWVAANRQTIVNSDPLLDLGEVIRSVTPRPRSALSTPLIAEGELVGVLSLYSTSKDAFNADHQRVAEMIARQAAQTLASALRSDAIRRTSFRDHRQPFPTWSSCAPCSPRLRHRQPTGVRDSLSCW